MRWLERPGELPVVALHGIPTSPAFTNGIAYDNWPVPPIKAVRALGDLIARLPRDAFAAVYAGVVRLLHDDAPRGRESARLHWRTGYAHDRGAAAFVRQVRSLRTEDTLAVGDRLPRLRDLPVAIAWGGADRLLPLAWAERLAADLDAHLEVIKGARHFTPEDHPEPVAHAVRRVVGLVG